MEKFGIFELLDTLSALSDSNLFSSPAQSAPATAPKEQPKPPERAAQTANSAALESFLQRHDAAKRRAEQRKP